MFLQNVVPFLPDSTASHHKTQYSQIIQLLVSADRQPYFPLQLCSRICMSCRISYDLFLTYYPCPAKAQYLTTFGRYFKTLKRHVLCI